MEIVVVGGGITGLFTSYYLQKRGHDVTIVDTNPNGRASIYNAGEISPSSGPESIGVSTIISRYLGFTRPAYFSPRVILSNTKWFRTALRPGLRDHEQTVGELGARSTALYEGFFREESMDPDIVRGRTMLYKKFETAERVSEKLHARLIDESGISDMGFIGFEGGAVMDEEFSVNPKKLFDGLRQKVAEMGVKQVFCSVSHLHREDSRIDYVTIDERRLKGEAYVVTAGSWCTQILKPLGYDPMILPARGLVLTFDTAAERIIRGSGSLEEEDITVVQYNENVLRVAGFFEMVGFRDKFSERSTRRLEETAIRHLKKSDRLNLKSVETDVGYMPCTPDQIPVIGNVPGYGNLYVASGNCGLGMTLAPVTADIVRGMIEGEEQFPHLGRNFSPLRFA
jgi:D-amino-acid dehydrogenase